MCHQPIEGLFTYEHIYSFTYDYRVLFNNAQNPLRLVECSGIITENKAIITTPNYPANYGRFLNCLWIFKPPRGAKRLKLRFIPPYKIESVNLFLDLIGDIVYEIPDPDFYPTECFDTVSMFDGESITSPLLGRQVYCQIV